MAIDGMIGGQGSAQRQEIERLIAEEVDKRQPRQASREALILIALGRVQPVPGVAEAGSPGRYRVLDEKGQPRTVEQDGKQVDLTIADVVAELYERHPTLFEQAPSAPQPELPATKRDWLMLARTTEQAADGEETRVLSPRDWLWKRGDSEGPVISTTAATAQVAHPVAEQVAQRRSFRAWTRPAGVALITGVAILLLLGVFATLDTLGTLDAPQSTTTPTERTAAGPRPSPSSASSAVTGVPEVIDTTTLKIGDNVLHLYGVEWARGGEAEDLRSYLGKRPVTCSPTPGGNAHRCEVEGRDLSIVVLFNGGARAAPEAPPELQAAEQYAKSEGRGVWKR